jgi:RluA family pseudouridine synthase
VTRAAPRHDKRWVVRPGDGATIDAIVKRAGEGEGAIAEGRVFLGRRRVTSGAERVRVGDEVRIGAPPRTTGAPQLRVLWERDGLLACEKPAGIPTVPDHAGTSHCLLALAASATHRVVGDLFVTSRLDREVSGVVVFATTAEAEARLRLAREQGRYARRYVAIAVGDLDETTRPWDAPIGRGRDPRHRAPNGPDSKPALTHWLRVARVGRHSLLAVEPHTGRTHQIRVHASHAGAPLFGDRDYGGPTRVTAGDGRVVALARIALHAARVTVPGACGELLVADSPVPAALIDAWTAIGGSADAWPLAVSASIAPSV